MVSRWWQDSIPQLPDLVRTWCIELEERILADERVLRQRRKSYFTRRNLFREWVSPEGVYSLFFTLPAYDVGGEELDFQGPQRAMPTDIRDPPQA